ncbi:hypothetical protein EYF80_004972 [Liparis tanakae]|uniref:Uncharacterized protein n=1 Tax=Liparis tanakae TaxID=230148 RepID=A0A4Z2J4I2_9TELE|nr:hypothetical protein EYF80_004972 [Liparis tanakae]
MAALKASLPAGAGGGFCSAAKKTHHYVEVMRAVKVAAGGGGSRAKVVEVVGGHLQPGVPESEGLWGSGSWMSAHVGGLRGRGAFWLQSLELVSGAVRQVPHYARGGDDRRRVARVTFGQMHWHRRGVLLITPNSTPDEHNPTLQILRYYREGKSNLGKQKTRSPDGKRERNKYRPGTFEASLPSAKLSH